MFDFIIILASLTAGVSTLMILIGYITHLSMVKSKGNYGKGDFNLFKKNFFKYDLKRDEIWKTSWFDRESDSKYHADIIMFDGKGMYMENPYEYFKVLIFMSQMYIIDKKIEKQNEIDWYKED